MPPVNAVSFDFIINRRAGEVLKRGEAKVREEILSTFGGKAGVFSYVEGADVAATVKAWAAEHAGQNRGLIVGGGDGTVISAAEQVLGRKDITFGVLPLGTQNMVARHLGFSPDFITAAAQYGTGQSVEMDVGDINGMPFLIGITLDKNSVKLFEAREKLRNKNHFSAARKSFSAVAGFLMGKKKEFVVSAEGENSQKIKGRFLAITNNRLQPRSARGFPFSLKGLKNIVARVIGKGEGNTGELSLYAFKGGVFRTLGILPGFLRGAWNRSKLIRTESATRFVVRSNDNTAETSFVLDGEIKKAQYPLDIRIIPKGLRIFKPQ